MIVHNVVRGDGGEGGGLRGKDASLQLRQVVPITKQAVLWIWIRIRIILVTWIRIRIRIRIK
jgi:hypothetical protein